MTMVRSVRVIDILTVIGLMGMSGLHVRVAAQQKGYIEVKGSVTKAVEQWQKDSGIKVTPLARRSIEDGFVKHESDLRSAFEQQGLDKKSQAILVESMSKEYLYDLRDSGKKNVRISSDEIERLPVDEFFVQAHKIIYGRTGRLSVTSSPDGGDITIDGESKGYTDKVFVVSVGEHDVSVIKRDAKLDCRGKIVVPSDRLERFRCP